MHRADQRSIGRIAFVATLLLAGAAAADGSPRADLTGAWDVTIKTERGDMNTAWDLVQHDDGTLTGTIAGRQGPAEVENGWVKDGEFAFVIHREFQGQSFEIKYEGTFSENALEGTVTAGEDGQFTAGFTGVRAGGETR